MRLWVDPWPHSVGQGSSVAISCGVGHRCIVDLALPWLCLWLAAVALITPLAWEPPYAAGMALKKKKKKMKQKKAKKRKSTTTNKK